VIRHSRGSFFVEHPIKPQGFCPYSEEVILVTEKQKLQSASCPTEQRFEAPSERKPVPQEQMQREVDYVRAQQILSSMVEKGLITLPEFHKITELNRKTFSPFLAEIMP